jgi:hypothetical protein
MTDTFGERHGEEPYRPFPLGSDRFYGEERPVRSKAGEITER